MGDAFGGVWVGEGWRPRVMRRGVVADVLAGRQSRGRPMYHRRRGSLAETIERLIAATDWAERTPSSRRRRRHEDANSRRVVDGTWRAGSTSAGRVRGHRPPRTS